MDTGYPPVEPSSSVTDGMRIERDIAIELRDGVTIYTDVFRPIGDEPVPSLIAWSAYAKQEIRDDPYEPFPERAGVPAGVPSRYAKFEGPDPLWWVPRGYAVINPDTRGSWNCEGDAVFWCDQEGRDIYDVVEWAAAQSWSNGRLGMSGVSYLAIAQWYAAAEQPPHLTAINPWEGVSDLYRDFSFHGGIPETTFNPGFLRYTATCTQMEDFARMIEAHPLWDDYWETKAAQLERIEVPAYVVASWSDQGLHTRGTLEGFKRISSDQKWLEVHGQKKWEYYYRPDKLEKQQQFFDHFLQGTDDAVLSWPPVLIEVRERHGSGFFREEREWPLARTEYRQLYLDAATATMSEEQPTEASSVTYRAEEPSGSAAFEYRFAEPTELTGHMKLRLWVEAVDADDLDLFVGVHKIDVNGGEVPFTYFAAWEDGPVALGWLRASHRELDASRSTPFQPWHPHLREQRLAAGEIVPVEIEVLPSSTTFAEGERLRLVVAATDIRPHGMEHRRTRNAGRHVLHIGGPYDAHLLVPVVP